MPNDHETARRAVDKLVANLAPDLRVTDVLTVEELRVMRSAYNFLLAEGHGPMTPCVPPEAEVGIEAVGKNREAGT